MVHHHNDKANAKHKIEVTLIAMRFAQVTPKDNHDYNDPFILYQDSIMSKRKLIELIANELTRE